MLGRILIASDLGPESNAVFPWAVTIAQAFPTKLYLLHVMHPASVNGPERLEDFPSLRDFLTLDRAAGFVPPLKASVPLAKMYVYHKDTAEVILNTAKAKKVDLICMAALNRGQKLAWWSAGRTVDKVLKNAPCSVLCVRGRRIKKGQWKRPHFRHILLLSDFSIGAASIPRLMPWVERFNSMLHIFPLWFDSKADARLQTELRLICQSNARPTNVLLFSQSNNRKNLQQFIADTPVDLIAMSPRTRAKFSHRLVNDVFVSLLKLTDVPVLLLH